MQHVNVNYGISEPTVGADKLCNFGYIGLIITLTTMSDSESLVNKGFCISTAFYDYSAVIYTSKNKKYNRIRIKLHTQLSAKPHSYVVWNRAYPVTQNTNLCSPNGAEALSTLINDGVF